MFFVVMTFCLFNNYISCINVQRIQVASNQSDSTDFFALATDDVNDWLRHNDGYFLFKLSITDQDNNAKFQWGAFKEKAKPKKS